MSAAFHMSAACSSLRLHTLRLVGSDSSVAREVFRLAEKRGSWEDARKVLPGNRNLLWERTWKDEGVDTMQRWVSALHDASDSRSPLMCALQASPCHALLARIGSNERVLEDVIRRSPSSLEGLSACEALCDWPSRLPGDSARAALASWRMNATETLLEYGGQTLARQADHAGRTALHYAAAAGDAMVARALLHCGAELGAQDASGRTAAHVAAAYCHDTLAEELCSDCVDKAAQPDAFGHNVPSMRRLQKLAAQQRREVGIERCSLPLTTDTLFHEYVALNRPVLIEGGASHLPAMNRWVTPDEFAKVLDGIQLNTGHVPYRGTQKLTLLEFVALERNDEGPQPYVFGVTAAQQKPELHIDMELFPPELRDAHVAYVRQPQLAIGFRGAGAPMHTHLHAFNALFTGVKRWWLVPPSSAFWSFEPMATWPESQQCKEMLELGLISEITQQAGDLLFVPPGWAHATRLEGDDGGGYGVGIGQEFIPNSSIYS